MRYLLIAVIILVVGQLMYQHIFFKEDVGVTTSSTVTISPDCKRVALLGCTPHPTEYLLERNELPHLLLKDFLDVDDLKDSFRQVLTICKNRQIDHLLIAYLPIYFVKMKQILGKRFVPECQRFLTDVSPQIASLIRDLKNELKISVPVTIILPTQEALEKVPVTIPSDEDRVRYSIKQFPRLEGIKHLQEILIINNKDSSQNEDIIRYLQYEYIFEPALSYTVSETSKHHFHQYLKKETR